jgi:hypothetical protein
VTTLKQINPTGAVRSTACIRPPTGVPARTTARSWVGWAAELGPQERRASTRWRPAASVFTSD